MQRVLPPCIAQYTLSRMQRPYRRYFDDEAGHSGDDTSAGEESATYDSTNTTESYVPTSEAEEEEEEEEYEEGSESDPGTGTDSEAPSSIHTLESSYDDANSVVSTASAFHPGVSILGANDAAPHVCIPGPATCPRPICVERRRLAAEEEEDEDAEAEAHRLRRDRRRREREAGSDAEESEDAEASFSDVEYAAKRSRNDA
jgi:hypothetical protein